ncbi:MAG: hypothetical protein DSY90_04755 [Deltaproteobacteria bacterium]|nr:MAG: hypothetical protein DSY90_04755 [Deltaproteobacteria bacterium]
MNNPSISIDIIIVNYNSTDYLIRCIESIYRSSGGGFAEIFVEDNASIDNVERVKERFPEVHLHINSKNIGFGAATNRAIGKGKNPYIVLINPDSKVESGLLDNAVQYLAANPDIGILGPRILDNDGAIQESARSFPTPLTALFGRQSLFSRLFPHNSITRANLLAHQSDGKTPMAVDWVSGACMLIRRRAIKDIGLLDERFFMYWEDADWCLRMWKKGWKVVYFPRTKIFHYVGKSSSKLLVRSIFEFHKSVYLFFNKYYNKSFRWLKPLILFGLFFRFCFVITSSKINEIILTRQVTRRTISKNRGKIQAPQKPISVMRIIARLNIGGPAIHVHLLNAKLNPARFKSLLVTGRISPLEGDMNYLFSAGEPEPIRIPELQREISLVMDIQAFFRIFAILKAKMPDIVHTHTAKAGFSARFAVIIYNLIYGRHVKLVHTFHGNVFEGYFDRFSSYSFILIEKIIARFTDIIIAISDSQRSDLIHRYKIAPARKLRTIRLGFDLLPFLNSGELKGKFRRLINVDTETVIIGIVGRLVAIKDHRMFLDAARVLMNQNTGMKVRFVVVGDGELRKELESYSRQIGLEKYVTFCGWIRNIPMVYADLDVLALTSKNEGTPVSIIEAMATGVPVIATNVGGVQDLLGRIDSPDDGLPFSYCERGVICKKNDAEGFAMGVASIIRKSGADPAKREGSEADITEMMKKSREFVVREYAQDRLIADIESLYDELMAQPGRDLFHLKNISGAARHIE